MRLIRALLLLMVVGAFANVQAQPSPRVLAPNTGAGDYVQSAQLHTWPPFVHWDLREFGSSCRVPWTLGSRAVPDLDNDGVANTGNDRGLAKAEFIFAFAAWEAVAPSLIGFREAGTPPLGGLMLDNFNTLTFVIIGELDDEQIVAVSATRLHNISGVYSGKDDPVMIMRTQKIFPAPEEALHPWKIGHKVTGDCRGSHVMHISPQPIEQAIKGSRFVNQVVLIGAERKFPAALIVPVWEQLESYCKLKGIEVKSRSELCRHPRIIDLLERQIAGLTPNLAKYELIKKIALLENEFSIEGGELTPTLKVKRRVIDEKYRDVIERLYEE